MKDLETMDLDKRLSEGPLNVRQLWTARQQAELAEAVQQRLSRRTERRVGVFAFAASAAAVALLLGSSVGGQLWSGFGSDRLAGQTEADHGAPLAVKDAPALQAPSEAVDLEDGSQVWLLNPETRFEVQEESGGRVTTRLARGAARFEVVPNPARSFEVAAGRVQVSVLGTIFTVAHEYGTGRIADGDDESRVRVSVTRGRVRVSWDGESRLLTGGESGIFPPPVPDGEALEEGADTPGAAAVSAPVAAQWRQLASRGDYRGAYVALKDQTSSVKDDPADLMLAADVARLSGHPGQALAPLRKVIRSFPQDQRAPLAAFTLGRVLLDSLGSPAEAAEAFKTARTKWPGGPLAVDALARESEARARAGQGEAASRLAAEYLRQYPEGRHADRMRTLRL